MSLDEEKLREIVLDLATKPGHEKVKLRVHRLLEDALGIPSSSMKFEQRMPEVRGRADALLGLTVIEFKSDMRSELRDAEEELGRYLADRERKAGQQFVGIATDGAEFRSYRLRGGKLDPLQIYVVEREKPDSLVEWLSTAVSYSSSLEPDPATVRRELGKESLAYAIARSRLAELYGSLRRRPDVVVKRQLWAKLLKTVYGADVDDDELFFQHTYLTVVAKTMATQVLGVPIPTAVDLLSGKPFTDADIYGAVESDFFDWVLDASEGGEIVERIARQTARFRLERIEHDVLKGLYESLIDPATRKDLGEYYTPDWLADWICHRVISQPLEQRVVDPACGSGTFLFQAVRLFLEAADAAKIENADALEQCVRHVLGVDIHPVAVIIARVTYLLALGERRLRRRRRRLAIPVYLGDSMQWNTEAILTSRTVRIDVPDGPSLNFPWVVTQDPDVFDSVVSTMLELSGKRAPDNDMQSWLERRGISDESDQRVLTSTYGHLKKLREQGRNHIWGYVARNLARPIWLSADPERAHVLVGNPPWLAYQHMSPEMQTRFRNESLRLGVWVGGRGNVSHQDLSGYFYARCAELYLRSRGTIAFVLPYAVLSRAHFRRFLTGQFEDDRPKHKGTLHASVHFVEAWGFDERVQPLFRVPSSVLIAEQGRPSPLPALVTQYFGHLRHRDATAREATRQLESESKPWPAPRQQGGWYEDLFRQGAIVVPRMMFLVERVSAGRFGQDPAAPVVKSHRSAQEKAPWKDIADIRGKVEKDFLRPLLLGESVAPFRVLSAGLAVIPWDLKAGELLDPAEAQHQGLFHLSQWLAEVERIWKKHTKRSKEKIIQRLDYFGQLSAQFPIAALRVVYAKAGMTAAAAIVRDRSAVVDHKLYWAAVDTEREGRYLVGLLNSEALRRRVAHLQSRGQWGARDFDKVLVASLPKFDSQSSEHTQLERLVADAEKIAGAIVVDARAPFTRARSDIRTALEDDGIAARIEGIAETILSSVQMPVSAEARLTIRVERERPSRATKPEPALRLLDSDS